MRISHMLPDQSSYPYICIHLILTNVITYLMIGICSLVYICESKVFHFKIPGYGVREADRI